LFPSSIPAGLLAYSTFDNLPVPIIVRTVVYEGSKAVGAYSSGDCSGLSYKYLRAPDSHFNCISKEIQTCIESVSKNYIL
jgi:hypothetical protein